MTSKYISRTEIAVLVGKSTNHVGTWCVRNQLPFKIVAYKRINGGREAALYDRETVLEWVARGHPLNSSKGMQSKKKKAYGISFQQVFSGFFERKQLQRVWRSKRLASQISKPQTIKVHVAGEIKWN